jgi:DNA-directed RNA polymerase subunit H (RpoH/RPB5)
LNPQVFILKENEIDGLMKKYNLKSLTQLPEIDRFDPLALALCLRPGQVCEMQRGSVTALSYKYYRICV